MKAHISTYNEPTISAGTVARTACLLLALTNQVLSALGKPVLPIESETVEQLVTAGITTVAALIAWWKNNSFTAAALEAVKRNMTPSGGSSIIFSIALAEAPFRFCAP